jgi:hypothetical protein
MVSDIAVTFGRGLNCSAGPAAMQACLESIEVGGRLESGSHAEPRGSELIRGGGLRIVAADQGKEGRDQRAVVV